MRRYASSFGRCLGRPHAPRPAKQDARWRAPLDWAPLTWVAKAWRLDRVGLVGRRGSVQRPWTRYLPTRLHGTVDQHTLLSTTVQLVWEEAFPYAELSKLAARRDCARLMAAPIRTAIEKGDQGIRNQAAACDVRA
jgi:hypothetical protein